MVMEPSDRENILLAIAKLKSEGYSPLAKTVQRLLAAVERFVPEQPRAYLADDVLDQITETLYPIDPCGWKEDQRIRHFRHMRLAFMLDNDALNEDLRKILKRGKDGKV